MALEIPENSKKEIEMLQNKLKRLIPQARLTDSQKLHLTLSFIGEQPENLKEALTKVIENAALGVSSFEITPAYIDGFPSLHNPHTIWVGVKGDIEKLLLIRERVKDGLLVLNLVVDERRFIPHLAIAKIKNLKMTPRLEVDLEKLMTIPFDPIKISSIKLFESVPEHGFHKHNTLAEVKLI